MERDGISEKQWDAIVVGTGVGGGTIGRALAEKGLSVLFLEKGTTGIRTEETRLNAAISDPVARTVRGFWPEPVVGRLNGQESTFYAPLGSGVGGSSVFYAAALERPEPHDFDDQPRRPHPTGGWPISYAEMQPYFEAAEAMYHVCGTFDPLSDVQSPMLVSPPPQPPGDAAIMEQLRRNGLHPYHLHSAIRHVNGCLECRGSKCPRTCKMDGRSAGVEPALTTGHAHLLDRCEVTRIFVDGARATGVRACHNGEEVSFKANRIILAAGALSSPRLLMASEIVDGSRLMGRNLMFHFNEIFAVWPKRSESFLSPSKSVGFRDLYHVDGERLGMVQAMGLDASYGDIVHHLRQLLARSPMRKSRLLYEAARLPAFLAARLLGNAKIFVGLLEDYPLACNRVVFDQLRPGRILFNYQVPDELIGRRARFRKLIRKAFRGQRVLLLTHRPEPNYGHPCGTLRFGRNAATSVLDPDCRVHGLENLYAVDSSFMPTSTGVNPSLTIAANALRVAERIQEGP
ncbi:MAG: glucose-methanol-choline oxidoreductase [Ahrensia sp.]|nr:glucose-methanol-choline oxidoreductase [Ahrensia sp.]